MTELPDSRSLLRIQANSGTMRLVNSFASAKATR